MNSEPVGIVAGLIALVNAVILLSNIFGLTDISGEQVAAIDGVLVAAGALLVRSKVSPV